jgi:hypothetical protein
MEVIRLTGNVTISDLEDQMLGFDLMPIIKDGLAREIAMAIMKIFNEPVVKFESMQHADRLETEHRASVNLISDREYKRLLDIEKKFDSGCLHIRVHREKLEKEIEDAKL